MLNTKQVEQLLNKTIKQVISSRGISLSNRKGNKELGLLTKKIARHPFNSTEEVTHYGEKIGTAIATLSQEKGKTELELGVIRQISFTSPEIAKLKTTNPVKKSKSSVSSKAEVIVPPNSSKTQILSETKVSPVETIAETVKEAVSDGVETAEEAIKEAQKNIEDTVETATEIAEDVAETVKEAVSDGVETTEEAIKETQKNIEDTVETATEIAEDVAETVKEAVSDGVETTEEAIKETQKNIEDTVETAKEITENVAETVKEAVSDGVETTEGVIEETQKNIEDTVEEIQEADNNSPTKLSLKDKIGEDIKAAMKAKDKVKLATVRAIKKAILEKEVELRPSGQETLTPEQELALLSQQAKQRRDSIEQYKQGGREDLVQQESQELAIIETYLPPQLSEQELEEIITKIMADVGATSPKDMGKVMGVAMKELKGKTDGKKVQAIVQNQLKES